MRRHLRGFFISISILILVVFIVFVINQTQQVVSLAGRVHPNFAQVVFWGLIILYALLLFTPVYLFFRLPKALIPPGDQSGSAYEKYLERFKKRLAKNALLDGSQLSSRADLEKAITVLNTEANRLIKKSATTVFITTAISQSGRLDMITVLVTLFRMVWQVAKVYYQRPSLRDMIQLYANVAATAFIAGELDDIDISQQVQPIIGSVLGTTLTGAIPGVNTVAMIITNSLLTGSANAYLTLRVGVISKQYCGSLVRKEKKYIRRSATMEAARMLSLIVLGSAGNISRAIVNAAIKSPGKISKDLIRSTWGKFSGKGKQDADFPPEFETSGK